MSRVTVCPQCGTRFRVTPEQLAARNGAVRCGRCANIFNAFETMADEPRLMPEQVQEIEITAPDIPAYDEGAGAQQLTAMEPLLDEPSDAGEDPNPAVETATEAANAEMPQEIRVVRVEPVTQRIESSVSPDNPKYGPPPKPRSRWPWVVANLLLAAGLCAQGIYFLRDSIAANYPPTRPMLEQACLYLQCKVGLPQKPDLIGIESSELHGDPAHANIVVLSSILRNRAPHVQAYPVLELTLTNTRDEMVARRVFTPKEYLANASMIPQGIAARGDIAIRLLLDLGDIKADGYRLYLFYPS